jgi:hypothetical protein
MRAVNVNDQLVRFSNMRQGDREYISDFKTRYDNQVKANEGVGIVNDDETLVAIDFLGKLDPKRFTSLLSVLRNTAAIGISSYPKTLAGAYRVASTWTSDGFIPSRKSHSAFVTDKKKASKEKPPKGGLDENMSSSNKTINSNCFLCGKVGHYCQDCPNRKSDQALVVREDSGYSDAESDEDSGGKFVAFVTSKTVLFAGHILLLNSQSSINVVAESKLLKSGSIRRTKVGWRRQWRRQRIIRDQSRNGWGTCRDQNSSGVQTNKQGKEKLVFKCFEAELALYNERRGRWARISEYAKGEFSPDAIRATTKNKFLHSKKIWEKGMAARRELISWLAEYGSILILQF